MSVNTRLPMQRTDAPEKEAKLFLVTEFSIAAGASQYFRSEIVPDHWNVSFYPATGMDCEVFLSADARGIGFRVGEGAKLKLPGFSRELSIHNNSGSVLAVGVVVAVKGYDLDLTLGRL